MDITRTSGPDISVSCPKADSADYHGRFREIISDPINLLIRRDPLSGTVSEGYVRLHNGIEVGLGSEHAYYGDFSQILILNRGVHEPLEEYAFQEVLAALPPNPIMLELGSYWAHYSMWMLKQRPGGMAVMVEPDPRRMAAGKSNFARNGFSGEFIEDLVEAGRFEVDVFMKNRSLPTIDLLHADIQGAELTMLEGSRDALTNQRIDRLFISTHSQGLHESVIQFLNGHDYRIDVSSDFNDETTSFDGLVIASRRSTFSIFSGFRPLGRSRIVGASPDLLLSSLVTNLCGLPHRTSGS